MTSIIELPEVRERISRLSVAEYQQLGEFNENHRRTELIRGIVIEKMSKSALHRRLSMRLFRMILPLIPSGFFVLKEEPLSLRDSEPEPDVSVIAGNEDDYARKHPSTAALVVEVAISSPALDRANAALYAEADVQEYWIVHGKEQRVEVYRLPVDGVYQQRDVFSRDQVLACQGLPTVRVDLAELFVMPDVG